MNNGDFYRALGKLFNALADLIILYNDLDPSWDNKENMFKFIHDTEEGAITLKGIKALEIAKKHSVDIGLLKRSKDFAEYNNELLLRCDNVELGRIFFLDENEFKLLKEVLE